MQWAWLLNVIMISVGTIISAYNAGVAMRYARKSKLAYEIVIAPVLNRLEKRIARPRRET